MKSLVTPNGTRAHYGRLLAILIVLVALFGITRDASAESIFRGDTIAVGEEVESDVILQGSIVTLNGTVHGDAFVLGRDVTIGGIVEGSLFVIADTIKISGDIGGSAYIVGLSATLEESGTIDRSAYVIAASLATEKDSTIERDLRVIGLGANLRGTVNRDTQAVIGLLEFIRLLMDGSIRSERQTGQSLIPEEQITTRTILSRAQGRVSSAPAQQEEDDATAEALDQWLYSPLRRLVSFLIVGLLAILLLPRLFTSWVDKARTRPLPAVGLGIVSFVSGFAGLLIGLFIAIAIGAFFYFITLNTLAGVTWAITISGVILLFSTFILFVIFVSKVIAVYAASQILLKRLLPRAAGNRFWPLLLGLFIYVLLSMVPYLGLVVGLVVTFWGLGAVWLAYSHRAMNNDLA